MDPHHREPRHSSVGRPTIVSHPGQAHPAGPAYPVRRPQRLCGGSGVPGERERATTHRGLSSPALVRVHTAFTLGSRPSSSLEAAPAYVYFASPVGGTALKRVRCGACGLRRRGSQVLLRSVFLLLLEDSGVGTWLLLGSSDKLLRRGGKEPCLD